MKPYACSVVPREDLFLFSQIEKIIQEMPDIDFGKNKKREEIFLSCHMIVRALARLFPLEIKDGFFGSNTHSWLITKNGLIIDPYPVAVVGGPILIETRFITVWKSLYKETSLSRSTLSGLNGADFLKNVDRVTKIIQQTMARLGIKSNKKSTAK
ncbi:hypothetical protein KJ735_00830 [Patescibacteria group bacterium]|nr:hypothetical protein [Patescibacteria group bacterium]